MLMKPGINRYLIIRYQLN